MVFITCVYFWVVKQNNAMNDNDQSLNKFK